MQVRKLEKKDVQFQVVIEEEIDPPDGHFASGDDKADAETVEEIRRQLARGNVWAWCSVKVNVAFGDITGESHWLGGCSYNDEKDFKQGGYYDDMCDEALDDLNLKLQALYEQIAPLLIWRTG